MSLWATYKCLMFGHRWTPWEDMREFQLQGKAYLEDRVCARCHCIEERHKEWAQEQEEKRRRALDRVAKFYHKQG